jgi:uncharacterized protein DUF3313
MRRSWFAIVAFVVILLVGCAARRTQTSRGQTSSVTSPEQVSGFLDDYSRLQPGGPDDPLLIYRDPDADWRAYDKVLLEPVSLWRSGKGSLDPVPQADLFRLAFDFEAAVRKRLGASFEIVDRPVAGAMRIRLAITDARSSDSILDVMTTSGRGDVALPAGNGALSSETERFLDGAAIEGEIRDAQTGKLLAAGVDRRRSGAPEIATWSDIDRIFALWADRVCSRLEARVKQP